MALLTHPAGMKAMSFIQRSNKQAISTQYRSPFAGNSTVCMQTVSSLRRATAGAAARSKPCRSFLLHP